MRFAIVCLLLVSSACTGQMGPPHRGCDAVHLTRTVRSNRGDYVIRARLVDGDGHPIHYARIDLRFDGVRSNEDFESTDADGVAVLRAPRGALAFDRRAYSKTFTGAFSLTFDGEFLAEGGATPPAKIDYCGARIRGQIPVAALPSPM